MWLLSIQSNQNTFLLEQWECDLWNMLQIILGFIIMTMSTTTTKRVLKRSRSDFEPSSTTSPSSRQQRKSTTSLPTQQQSESNKENGGVDERKRKQKDKKESSKKTKSRDDKSLEPVGRKRGYFRFKDLPIAIGKAWFFKKFRTFLSIDMDRPLKRFFFFFLSQKSLCSKSTWFLSLWSRSKSKNNHLPEQNFVQKMKIYYASILIRLDLQTLRRCPPTQERSATPSLQERNSNNGLRAVPTENEWDGSLLSWYERFLSL